MDYERFIAPPLAGFTALALLSIISTGCSTTHYHKSADKEVYGILEAARPAVPGMTEEVNIDPAEPLTLDGFPRNEERFEFLGVEADEEVGAAILSLERALEIAFTQSREYQTRKEQLYLEALALTLDRHQFAPIFSAGASVDHVWGSNTGSPSAFRGAVDEMTGAPGRMIQQYASVLEDSGTLTRGTAIAAGSNRTRSIEGGTSIGLDMLMMSGARFALDLSSNFTQFLTGGGAESAFSALRLSFVQPLLRGAGRAVTTEFLNQAERDVLYELRDFTRFRKTFSVRVASQYYQVLRQRDAVRTNHAGLESFELSLERERAFQAEGLRTPAEVGRLEQSTLQRDSQLTRSLLRYKQSLDNFKILLGFATDAPIILDDRELERLVERGIQFPELTSKEAVDIALVTRLDLYSDRDRVFDAERRINVAENALKADLNLVFAGAVDSKSGNRFATFDFDNSEWTAGFDLDLPLDRKAERNNYRRALIDYEVFGREAELAEDTVRLDVRDAWRSLQQAQKDYEISQASVNLNQRRVEEEDLRAELGLGDIINQVDAQNDLTNARTSLTGALVDHTVAVLNFWRDIGILYVKDNGQWEEVGNG